MAGQGGSTVGRLSGLWMVQRTGVLRIGLCHEHRVRHGSQTASINFHAGRRSLIWMLGFRRSSPSLATQAIELLTTYAPRFLGMNLVAIAAHDFLITYTLPFLLASPPSPVCIAFFLTSGQPGAKRRSAARYSVSSGSPPRSLRHPIWKTLPSTRNCMVHCSRSSCCCCGSTTHRHWSSWEPW